MRPCALVFALPLLLFTRSTPADEGARLAVEADGFGGDEGHAILRLYRPGDEVTREPRRAVRVPVERRSARFVVLLPPGAWAAVVHHDRNDNGRIDHAWTGLPAEPLGFSGGFRLGLLSGKPTFAKLRFELPAGGAALAITVR